MKRLLVLLLSLLAFSSINAQVSTQLDGTGSYVSGGNGSGKIVSYSWVLQANPPAAVTIINSDKAVSTVTFTQKGDYYFLLTVTDNNGINSSAIDTVTVFAGQVPHAKATNSHVYLSLPNSTFNYEKGFNRSFIDNHTKLFFFEEAANKQGYYGLS